MHTADTPPGEVSTSTSSSTDEDAISFDSGIGTASAVTTTHLDSEHSAIHVLNRPHWSTCASSSQRHERHKSRHQSGQKSAKLPRSGIFVIYSCVRDWHQVDTSVPFANRIEKSEITLGYFKEKVFSREGHYRFFFKTYYDELDMEVMEEYTDCNDSQLLPVLLLARGKRVVIGTVTCSWMYLYMPVDFSWISLLTVRNQCQC